MLSEYLYKESVIGVTLILLPLAEPTKIMVGAGIPVSITVPPTDFIYTVVGTVETLRVMENSPFESVVPEPIWFVIAASL
jgi:hypothetical protein